MTVTGRPTPTAVAPADHTPRDDVGADWAAALAVPGPAREEALRGLHALMLRASRHQVRRMRSSIPALGPDRCDEIALAAADDALAALLGKLHTFEGRSRFTTWAYKFAILQAATEVRRQAWAGREVGLDGTDAWPDCAAGPEAQAEAADLAGAVTVAIQQALTDYQRKIAVALLVDLVPIDVLAERLGTTRGALYKTLHVARTRIRAHLVSAGYLDDPEGSEE